MRHFLQHALNVNRYARSARSLPPCVSHPVVTRVHSNTCILTSQYQVPDSLRNPQKRVEYREFKYLMKRCGGHGDSHAWFLAMAKGGVSVLLDDAANYIAGRIFFPKRAHHGDDGKAALSHMTFAERMKARATDRREHSTPHHRRF